MYKKKKKSWTKHLDFLILDLIGLILSLYISYELRDVLNPMLREFYVRLAIVVALIHVCVALFFEAYKGILRRDFLSELRATVVHSVLVFLCTVVYIWGTKQGEVYSRQILYVFLVGNVVILYIARTIWKRVVRYHLIHKKRTSQMVIVTEARFAKECISVFENDKYKDFEIAGLVIIDEDQMGTTVGEIPVIANADNYMQCLKENVVDEVFIHVDSREQGSQLVDQLLEIGVTVHYNLVQASGLRPNKIIEQCGRFMVLTTSMKIASNMQILIKRLMDIAGAMVGMAILMVAIIIFAPIIKIQSPGPIFYSQTRIGKNGRRFKFYKFRTMVVGADAMKKDLMAQNEMNGLMFKMKDDPRIFGIGKFLRKYSIDELPQFWNVLKGDMSLVGTRPPTENEFEQYALHHKARLGIKPGLTGMWQVSGRSDIHDFEEVVALDTQYITNWSVGLDIRIILKTVLVVITGKGSS